MHSVDTTQYTLHQVDKTGHPISMDIGGFAYSRYYTVCTTIEDAIMYHIYLQYVGRGGGVAGCLCVQVEGEGDGREDGEEPGHVRARDRSVKREKMYHVGM